jgi:malate/lactate dehydrogenase
VLRPYVTQFTGAKTPLGTAEIVMRLVGAVLSGTDTLTACQTRLEGDFLGLHGTIGVPVVMSNAGVRPYEGLSLTADEEAGLRSAFDAAQEFLSEF